MEDALPGQPSPLGATPRDGGINFAVASSVAEAAEVCLFDDAGHESRFRLPDYDGGAWHGFVPGSGLKGSGQAYGFRVRGPYDTARGLRCNPAKLLLDPYARAVRGEVSFGPEVFDYSWDDHDAPSPLDSAGHVPLSLVTDAAFDWGSDAPLRRDFADTIIYEVHVKGFTMRHPGVPEDLRGTYAGLAHESVRSYLSDLGVTAVELLPVHQYVPDEFLLKRGLTNYWGYNTIGYFAPHAAYSAAVRAGFPALWREWNGRYRDSMRDFWRSQKIGLGEFATRFAGSYDLYGDDRRRPTASVNLITVHDGFTLRDLVSYDGKHNEANGEDNRDGANDNRSWNSGAEGPTEDPAVLALRAKRSRAMLCTLLLSFGVPMLLGGDELGRTQGGNNNAYCQDNEISWVDWSAVDAGLLAFTRDLVALRRSHPVLRRHRYLTGVEAAELGWFTPAGTPMTQADWADGNALALGVYLDGSDAPDTGPDGQPLLDDDFLVLVNGWWEPLEFTIGECRPGLAWRAEIDTFDPTAVAAAPVCRVGDRVTAGPRSVLVLRGPRV